MTYPRLWRKQVLIACKARPRGPCTSSSHCLTQRQSWYNHYQIVAMFQADLFLGRKTHSAPFRFMS